MVSVARAFLSILCILIARVPADAQHVPTHGAGASPLQSQASRGVRRYGGHAESAAEVGAGSISADCPADPEMKEMPKMTVVKGKKTKTVPTTCKPSKAHRVGWPQAKISMCACKNFCLQFPTCQYAVCSKFNGNKCQKCFALSSCESKPDKKGKAPAFERVTLTGSTTFDWRRSMPAWPTRNTTACSQITKQKSMYGDFTFEPSLLAKPAFDVRVSVRWEDAVKAPWRGFYEGGVYAAWTFGVKDGPGGYFGAQITEPEGHLIFSIWDSDRWVGSGHSREPKRSSQLVWPLDLTNCWRNCQDCGLPELREIREAGLTTGTQCRPNYMPMKDGGHVEMHLQQIEKRRTINTRDYGGMPTAHAQFGEVDREVTGAVWEVTMTDLNSGAVVTIGTLLFENNENGLYRMRTFDEMLGCNHCNDMYHRDTRFGPFITDEDGSIRQPTAMRALSMAIDCKKYKVTGDKTAGSITFEGGPGVSANIPADNHYHEIW